MNKEDTEQCVLALLVLRHALYPSAERTYLEIENTLLACTQFMDAVPMSLLDAVFALKGDPRPLSSGATHYERPS